MGIPVFLLRENMHRTENIETCIAESQGDKVFDCAEPRELFYDPVIDASGFPSESENITMFDTSKYTCDADQCYGIVGNIAVLRDENHLTTTFANSALPFLDEALREFVPHLTVEDEKTP